MRSKVRLINRKKLLIDDDSILIKIIYYRKSIFSLVGSPIKSSDKYNKVEKMVKVYVGIHDRINDEIRQDRVYSVENIKIVTYFKMNLSQYN